jgi:hypothetical protein
MKKTLITIGTIVVVILLLAIPKLNFFKKDAQPQGAVAGGPGARAGRLSVDALILKPSVLECDRHGAGE